MSNKEFLSIKEYADLRGVSQSAVYKRLKTTLQPYLVEVEGQKMLKIQVLEGEDIQPSNRGVEEVSTPTPQPSSTILEKQLDVKDKQIEMLNEQIKELQKQMKTKDLFIQEQSKKLTDLLEQSNILMQNNQMLLAQQNDQSEPEAEEIINAATVEPDRNDPTEKKSWFKRMFG